MPIRKYKLGVKKNCKNTLELCSVKTYLGVIILVLLFINYYMYTIYKLRYYLKSLRTNIFNQREKKNKYKIKEAR